LHNNTPGRLHKRSGSIISDTLASCLGMTLNDTTLARGQVQQGSDGGTVDIAATQATPGVGPWDNGGSIVNTALQSAPAKHDWILYVLLVLAGVVLAGVATWVIIKRRRGARA
jgi:hypothetical protein